MRIRYIDVGPRDAPPLLLVHGLTSRLEEYEQLLPILAQDHRVLVPDLPGSGYSDKPLRRYSLAFLEDSLLGFLDAAGARREAVVGGGSLGGNLALRLGHRAPDRFPRLVAWAPGGAWHPKWWAHGLEALASPWTWWPAIWVQSRYWYETGWHGRDDALRQTFSYYREVHGPGFVRMYWDLAVEQLRESLFPMAGGIPQPTLLAWGDRDHGLGMGHGIRELVKRMPRATLRVFAGAAHALATEVPEDLAVAIRAFLGESAPAPASVPVPARPSQPS